MVVLLRLLPALLTVVHLTGPLQTSFFVACVTLGLRCLFGLDPIKSSTCIRHRLVEVFSRPESLSEVRTFLWL